MTVHLVKLCVGVESVADLDAWARKKASANEKAGKGRVHDHVTRMRPRRQDAIHDGGSLYWVIKGVILVRQAIVGFEQRLGGDGVERTAILLAPDLVLTEPQPRRAFQGWRYLSSEDAPKDLRVGRSMAAPPELSVKLAELGLL